jgi:hypothetical protein
MSAEQLAAIPEQWAQPPAEMVGKLPKGGTQLDYVGHATVTKILLGIDPEWTLIPVCDERGIPIVEHQGSDAVMWGHLTVLGHTRMGVGTCSAKSFDLHKQLVSDLLRNCAMRFGIATALWSKEEWSQPAPSEPVAPVGPMADRDTVDALTVALMSLNEAETALYQEWRKEHGVPSLKRPVTEAQADAIAAWLDTLHAQRPFTGDDK